MVNMRVRDQKRLLWMLNLALGLGVALSAYALGVRPLSVREPLPAQGTLAPHQTSRQKPLQPLTAYAVISSRNLRKPLFDLEPAVEAASKPKLNLTLTGTVIDPGLICALLRDGSGQTKLVSVGESIGGAQLMAVTEDSATLQYGGELVTLKLQKPEGGP